MDRISNITETPLARLREARIIGVVRDGEPLETPLDSLRLAAGDQLLLETTFREPEVCGHRFR